MREFLPFQGERPLGQDGRATDFSDDGVLHNLEGGVLEQVWFVASYVQLIFWVPIDPNWSLQCYAMPDVVRGDTRWTFGDSGYRDALCEGISSSVLRTDEIPGRGLLIELETQTLEIMPRDHPPLEIAMLHPLREMGETEVWRVGEGVFAHFA